MSNWTTVRDVLTSVGAPILATLVGGPVAGASVAMDIIGSALGVDAKPDSVMAAINADPEAAVKLREAEIANATRLAEVRAEIAIAEIRESGANYRADITSDDKYVKRMRPTFGYIITASWAAIFGAFAMRLATAPAAEIMVMATAIATLMPVMALGLAVIGVYVAKRTDEKAMAAGHAPPIGIISAIASRIGGAKK